MNSYERHTAVINHEYKTHTFMEQQKVPVYFNLDIFVLLMNVFK